MEITTRSGFKCKVNENKIKDWRYVTTSTKIAKSDNEIEIVNGVDFLLRFLLGDEQTDKLIEHISDKDGIAGAVDLVAEFKEITGYVGEQVKKSQSSQA